MKIEKGLAGTASQRSIIRGCFRVNAIPYLYQFYILYRLRQVNLTSTSTDGR